MVILKITIVTEPVKTSTKISENETQEAKYLIASIVCFFLSNINNFFKTSNININYQTYCGILDYLHFILWLKKNLFYPFWNGHEPHITVTWAVLLVLALIV